MRNIKRCPYWVHFILYVLCAAVLLSLLCLFPIHAKNRSVKSHFIYDGLLDTDANGNRSGNAFDSIHTDTCEVFNSKNAAANTCIAVAENTNAQHFNSCINYLYAWPIDFVLLFGGILLLISIFILVLSKYRIKSANKIRKMLYTDALTGYPNYKALTEAAPKLLGSHPELYSLLYLDMHQFKYINDTFGYETGDKILCSISGILNNFIDSSERFARVYADKFVLLLKRNDIDLFRRRLDELSAKLSQLNSTEFHNVNFVFSCGIYHLKHNAWNIDMACDRANYAKDTVQNVFSNTFVFYDDLMRTQILSEKSLESSMRPALDNGEFIPYFQPKVNVITEEVVGVEALVRWNHPKKGILPPACFIPFFEKNGFVVKIDFTIFETVCRILHEWIDGGNQPVPISVNFSRRHMADLNFTDKLKEIIERYSIPPQLVEIEITETVALDNIDKAVEFAQALKDNGFLVSIDDYGTGYSSIAFLQKLPVDVLKLDKSFIENAMQSKKAKDIMRQLVQTIRDNQISVVCEGIETEEQKDFMISQNCCLAQGYLYARPMPQDKFEVYLKKSKIAGHEFLEFIPMANFEQQIRTGAADFLNRVMPGWILGCHLDAGLPIFYISPQLLTALGYSEPEFIHETGALFLNCLHPEDVKHVSDEMDENKWTSNEYILQYRLRKKDGGSLWIRDIGKKILTDNGKEALLCVCTDITDMVTLQQEKDDLIGAIPGGVCDLQITQDGLIIESATDKFYTIIGHSKEELAALGNNLYAVIYEKDISSARSDIRNAAIAGRTVCESRFRVIYSNGSLHWFFMRGALHQTENGKAITVIGYIVDSEVRAKENAEIIKAKMELALTLTDHAVYEYDILTKIIYEQNGLYKYITEDMTLENIPDSLIESGFIHPEDAASFCEMIRRIENGESYASSEMRIKNVRAPENAPYIWIRTILSTVYDENNQPIKAVGIVEDIDHQKQIEVAYVQEEQYRQALTAASILSYDIDLTRNTVDKIAGGSSQRIFKLQGQMEHPNHYSELLNVSASFIVAAEDRERFLGDMNRTNLLKLYADGITDLEYEYRRLLPDNTISWVSASLHIVTDKISGNTLCLVHYRDIQARKNMEENLKYNASRDSLTGLLNRASGERLIEEYLNGKYANGGIHAFMMIDVDHFKIINDTFGHQYGDTFLVIVAKAITNSLCGNDIIVRMGGDEFAVLIKDLSDEQTALDIAQSISETISETGNSLKPAYKTAVSIGIAIAPQHGEDFDVLYHHADEAMYCAKKKCGTHIALYQNSIDEINIDDLK